MASEDEMEAALDEVMEDCEDAINDTSRFSQGESADLWRDLARRCTEWEQMIRSEM